jgi:hypothetical protein
MHYQRDSIIHGSEYSSDTTFINHSALPINPVTINSVHGAPIKTTIATMGTTERSVTRTSPNTALVKEQVLNRVTLLPDSDRQNLVSLSPPTPLINKTSTRMTGPAETHTSPKALKSTVTHPNIPPNTQFDIRGAPGKGYGLFAKAAISRGTLLLAEEPLLRIDQRHYVAKDVRGVYEKLSKEKQTKYCALSSAHGQDASWSVLISQFRQILEDKLISR